MDKKMKDGVVRTCGARRTFDLSFGLLTSIVARMTDC